jgi:hypothetical protein
MSVKNAKVVHVYQNLNATTDNTFKFNIALDFVPDEMIVRQIGYQTAAGGDAGYYSLHCDLIGDAIAIFADSRTSSAPGTTFIIKKPVNSSYKFSVNYLGDNYSQLIGNISVLLEFIKY